MIKKVLILLVVIPAMCWAFPKTPNINIAPGDLCTPQSKDFVEYRYPERIPYCQRNVSTRRKNKICAEYGVYDRSDYTVDHIIPLSAGGSNSDKNLWCQSRKIYTGKIERWMYERLRDGNMTQAEAVRYILSHKFNPSGKDHIPYPPK